MLSQRTLCSFRRAAKGQRLGEWRGQSCVGLWVGEGGVPGGLLLCVTAIRSVNEIIAAKNQFGVNYKSLTAK